MVFQHENVNKTFRLHNIYNNSFSSLDGGIDKEDGLPYPLTQTCTWCTNLHQSMKAATQIIQLQVIP